MILKVNSLKLLKETPKENRYLLSLEKEGMKYKAGQYFSLDIPNSEYKFYYSAFSHPKERYLVFYIRSRPDSYTEEFLTLVRGGSQLNVEGGYGFNQLTGSVRHSLFISQGTGISPVRSLYMSSPSNVSKTCLHFEHSEELKGLAEVNYSNLLRELIYNGDIDSGELYDQLDIELPMDTSPKDIYYCVERDLEKLLTNYLEQKYVFSKLINLGGR